MQGAVFPAVGAEAVCAYLSCGRVGDAVEYMANIVVACSLDVRDAGWEPIVKDRVCTKIFHQVEVGGGAGNNDLKSRTFE